MKSFLILITIFLPPSISSANEDIAGSLSLSDGAILIRKVNTMNTRASVTYRCYRWEDGVFVEGPRPLFIPGKDPVQQIITDYDEEGRLVVRVLYAFELDQQYTHLWYPFESTPLDDAWEEPERIRFMRSGGQGQVATVYESSGQIEVKTGGITDRELKPVVRFQDDELLKGAEYGAQGHLILATEKRVHFVHLSGHDKTRPENTISGIPMAAVPLPGVKTKEVKISALLPGQYWRFGLIVHWFGHDAKYPNLLRRTFAVRRGNTQFKWDQETSSQDPLDLPIRMSEGTLVYKNDYAKVLNGKKLSKSSGLETLRGLEKVSFNGKFHFFPVDSGGTIPGSRLPPDPPALPTEPPSPEEPQAPITDPGERDAIDPEPVDQSPSMSPLEHRLLMDHEAEVRALGPFRPSRIRCHGSFTQAIIDENGHIPSD